jgi:hypothetical protein
MGIISLVLIAAAVIVVSSCDERAPVPRAVTSDSCDAPGVRQLVEQLGQRMKQVSLQAPDSVVAREIRRAYAPLVTPSLLEAWTSEPTRAPGRDVSSPWPERIEVRSVEMDERGLCRVQGEVAYVTSAEVTQGRAASRELVTLFVARLDDGWRISAYEKATPLTR